MLEKIQDTRLPEEVGYLSFLVFCSKVSQLEELLNKLLNGRVASVCDTLRERREESFIIYKIGAKN
ncbi:MAG: hypothetical protein V7L31_22425 [Nostoc sp.]|uniref:hypothetical protein n=1 Tax=Nostoc sp. TaxID=1180 RepID=UPI002FF33912